MRAPKILSVLNALVAATVLVVVSVTIPRADISSVSNETIVEAMKNTSPEDGLQMLAARADVWQRRATVLRWLCYGAIAMLAVNAMGWAVAAFEPGKQPVEK